MRIATYTRISTDEDHQPYSLEAQAGRLESYVTSQDGWELVRTFSDQMSGAKLERPGLQRALTEARAARFDLLLVYRVDRFARSVRGLAQLLEELDAAGVGFRSATEPFDTSTAAGRMMVQMLGVFAEFERATIIDRVIAGMERKAARGGWCVGPPPFGYQIDDGVLAVNESEAPLVPLMFDLYAMKRLGTRAVANWLNDAGHRSRSGRAWSHTAVTTVLRNRTYLGEVYFRGKWHPASHQPLVNSEQFDAANVILNERGEDLSKRASVSSDYLLTGLVICELCGKHYVGNAAHGRSARYRYYTCHNRQRYGTGTCASERLSAEELDQAILAALLTTYEKTDLFDRAVKAAAGQAEAARARREAELATLIKELECTEERIERYLLAFEAGNLPESACAERVKKLATRVGELQGRRVDLLSELEAGEPAAPTESDLSDLRRTVEEAIAAGSPATQKALIQALVHEIRVMDRNEIQPVFKMPPGAQPESPVRAPYGLVGMAGFEPAASASQTPRANQAALHPVELSLSRVDGTNGTGPKLMA